MGETDTKRAKKPKRLKHQGKVDAAEAQTELRAMWLVQLIQDRIWLYGKYSQLQSMTMEKYRISETTAAKAIARAYDIFREGIKKWTPDIGPWLTEVHRQTIQLGFEQEDPRAVTGAAVALAKLSGAEAADKVHVTGESNTTITVDERNLVKALRLTNAQRLAEIDKLSEELGLPTVSSGKGIPNFKAAPEFVSQPPSPTEEDLPEQAPDPHDEDLAYVPPVTDEDDEDDE